MQKLTWYVKQLLPLTYRSHYRDKNGKHFAVWNMWLGKVFNYEDHLIVE